jgi:hypothetical protein
MIFFSLSRPAHDYVASSYRDDPYKPDVGVRRTPNSPTAQHGLWSAFLVLF